MVNINVAEVISESFERALNTGKREDSFSNALMILSMDATRSEITEMFQTIKNSDCREEILDTLTSYFEYEENVFTLLGRL